MVGKRDSSDQEHKENAIRSYLGKVTEKPNVIAFEDIEFREKVKFDGSIVFRDISDWVIEEVIGNIRIRVVSEYLLQMNNFFSI